jgi:hypothetical protein
MKHFGSAAWNGDLREGKGSVSTEGPALETYPYTLFSRYREKAGHQSRGADWAGSRRLFQGVRALSASTQLVHPKPGDWRCRL